LYSAYAATPVNRDQRRHREHRALVRGPALADGSVRFVTNNIDLGLWRAMGTRAGGETISLP
jgi:hypothetical protein